MKNCLKLPGYHELIVRNRVDSNRGGVGIFVKESITFTVREDLSVFIPHIFKSIFIEFVQGKKKNMVGIIYKPNTQPKADMDIFSATLLDIIGIINDEKKTLHINGRL